MATKYDWPALEDRSLIGKRHNRVDGPAKARGAAKYSHDRNLEGMLHARLVTSTVPHGRIISIDTSMAEKVEGYKGHVNIMNVGDEVQWVGTEILAICADTEEHARDAAAAVNLHFEILPHWVKDEDVKKAGEANRVQPAKDDTKGPDFEAAWDSADETVEGYYGLGIITHCCLEPHGQVVDWTGDDIKVYASTQAVARIPADLARGLSRDESIGTVEADSVEVITPYMGGGFGSKFNIDTWGIACAKLSKKTGRPVKLMLDRDEELMVAGGRPSDYGNVKIGARRDGTLVAYESETWSTGGIAGRGSPPLPYVYNNEERLAQKARHLNVSTNIGPARAWRAPNHPQAAVLTMCPMEDLAAKLGMDPVEFFKKNADLTARPEVYRYEIDKCAEMIGWNEKWHKRGDSGPGPVKSGLGLSLHTWGGRPHDSTCEVRIQPDGGVSVNLASQDLGVGTYTTLSVVAAETLGLQIPDIKINIGNSRLPISGASGGSTTVGGTSASTRRATVNALEELKGVVAGSLGVGADDLVAKDGKIFAKSDPSKSLSWTDACRKLGNRTITGQGRQPDRDGGKLNDSGVGGVQMADVSVDVETGVVSINKLAAVQDVGLVLCLEQCESQVYGSMIQGVAWALYEEAIYDQATGKMLNPDMEFYKLPGAGDIGEMEVHMVQNKYDDRGVIGIGEPPAISPGAAISNAVANAIGVRVPTLPLTPDRVLAALASA